MIEVLRNCRLVMIFCIDMSMVILAWFTAFSLCMNLQKFPPIVFTLLPGLIFIQACSFYYCGLYRGIWRFASIPDLIRIVNATSIGVLGIIVFTYIYTKINMPSRVIPIVYGMLLILFLSAPRVFFRWLKDYQSIFHNGKRILIVGAGSAGDGIVRNLSRYSKEGFQAVAFVDDNVAILGKEIHGIRVRGSSPDIPRLVKELQIELILIAVPSASSSNMRRIVSFCERANVPFQTLPSLKELTEGRVSINALREVSLEDLLGREQINLAWEKICVYIMNKTVLVTGGGGSIGSELSTQLASLAPANLIIVDNCEYNIYSIEMKLRKKFPNLNLNCILCSVTDREGIKNTLAKFRPELIFHAAAYKHVPLLETNLRVAIHNNIVGTRIISEEAVAHEVKTFVLISTDKAVHPTNIMGATKRASEIFCQNFNDHSSTQFITVRFGNVLDSAGSVVPRFRAQLQEGGPLTVTHPDMTRFFMTIPEASQLIMQAASLGGRGEIFVLDMGEPIKISYLAEQLIRLSGKILGEDVHIQYTGLRPGEKLHEELFYAGEQLSPTIHPKIHRAKAQRCNWTTLLNQLNQMEEAYVMHDESKLFSLLCQVVPEYQLVSHKVIELKSDQLGIT